MIEDKLKKFSFLCCCIGFLVWPSMAYACSWYPLPISPIERCSSYFIFFFLLFSGLYFSLKRKKIEKKPSAIATLFIGVFISVLLTAISYTYTIEHQNNSPCPKGYGVTGSCRCYIIDDKVKLLEYLSSAASIFFFTFLFSVMYAHRSYTLKNKPLPQKTIILTIAPLVLSILAGSVIDPWLNRINFSLSLICSLAFLSLFFQLIMYGIKKRNALSAGSPIPSPFAASVADNKIVITLVIASMFLVDAISKPYIPNYMTHSYDTIYNIYITRARIILFSTFLFLALYAAQRIFQKKKEISKKIIHLMILSLMLFLIIPASAVSPFPEREIILVKFICVASLIVLFSFSQIHKIKKEMLLKSTTDYTASLTFKSDKATKLMLIISLIFLIEAITIENMPRYLKYLYAKPTQQTYVHAFDRF